MSSELLLGNEAVARGAIDAGIAGAFSYPGTPSTEIFEYIAARAERAGISARWSANEKVAYEEALGMSYAGRRALVSMKHVGLNVAADPFISSAMTGASGALVLAVADDPGMHSSQNEQDTRYYADLARLPLLEPATQQQAYEMTREAFEMSEALGLPVLVRLTTRLSHSRANIEVTNGDAQADAPAPKPLPDPMDWTLVPVNARRRNVRLLSLQSELEARSSASRHNQLELRGPRGIIAAGIAQNYVLEALDGNGDFSLLKIGTYPLPRDLVRQLVDHCDEITVIEEGYPFIERLLVGLLGVPGKAIRGRLDGALPRAGELGVDLIAEALGRAPAGGSAAAASAALALPTRGPLASGAASCGVLPVRPPQLCRGCPHADSFRALVEATASYDEPILFSDIGCYTLGVMPPYRAVHSCVDMGASISLAHGAAQAGRWPVLCTVGDSTFGHSGMTPLLGAARHDADITVVILDNDAVAMTGFQGSLMSGDRLLETLRGLGVAEEHLHVIEPLPRHHEENVATLRRAVEHRGLSVVVAVRACVQAQRRRKRRAQP